MRPNRTPAASASRRVSLTMYTPLAAGAGTPRIIMGITA